MNKDYRLSSYTIVTELDHEPDCACMIHGYTGAIDVVNKDIVAFLESHNIFKKSDIPCSETTQETLEKRGYITTRTAKEETEYVEQFAKALFKKETILGSGFTVVMSYDCNFCCPYCFEKGIRRDTTTFTHEMTDKLYQTIETIAPDKKLRSNEITLYGGEPLMKENKEAVTYFIKRGKELGFTFSAITNGYDLNHYEDLLENIRFVQITIDGVRERHNARRLHCRAIPTFDKIVENIGLALEKGVKVAVRVNTDRDNIDDIKKLNSMFDELHYNGNKLFSMYSARLQDYSEGEKSEYKYLAQTEYVQKLDKLDLGYICQDYGLSNKISSAINNGKPLLFRSTYCNSQTKGFVLDPLVYIYPCWEVVNRKEHRLGCYKGDEIIWNNEIMDMWRKCILLEKDCIKCKYALLCSGGCPAARLKSNRCLRMEDLIRTSVNKAFKTQKK